MAGAHAPDQESGFDSIPTTLGDVAAGWSGRRGLVTLAEIRECLALIARAILERGAQPVTLAPLPEAAPTYHWVHGGLALRSWIVEELRAADAPVTLGYLRRRAKIAHRRTTDAALSQTLHRLCRTGAVHGARPASGGYMEYRLAHEEAHA